MPIFNHKAELYAHLIVSLLPENLPRLLQDYDHDSVLYGSPEEQYCDDLLHNAESTFSNVLTEPLFETDAFDEVRQVADSLFADWRDHVETGDLHEALMTRFDLTHLTD